MSKQEQEKIAALLRDLSEFDPPADTVDKVMEKIYHSQQAKRGTKKKSGSLQTTGNFFLRSRFGFVPMVSAVAAAAVIFWLGYETGKYKDKVFGNVGGVSVVKSTIEGAEANYLVGRGLFVSGLQEDALPLLQIAARVEPDNPEYAYWEGLVYMANGNLQLERQSYLRGVASNPDAIPLLLNLGHSYLSEKIFDEASHFYGKVLELDPLHRSALYNMGLIYHLKNDKVREADTWKRYLTHFRSGKEAFRAVDRLNSLGDVTFRSYQLGIRRLIFSQELLLQPENLRSEKEIDLLADVLLRDPELVVDIVVFNEGDADGAKETAFTVRKKLVDRLGVHEKNRIRLSWFGEMEGADSNNQSLNKKESLLLFGRHIEWKNEETKV